MTEWNRHTDAELRDVDRNIPVLIPIGLIEAHGPHLSVNVDVDTAEYFAHEIAKRTGAIVVPTVNYGFADEMREYPGTIGVRPETLALVIHDIVINILDHGFRKVILISGHGANKMPCEMSFWKIWDKCPEAQLAYWNWWTEAGIDGIHHADKGETEVAAAVGSVYYPERAKDFLIDKPWYKLRSRFAIQEDSGGINGRPTEADPGHGRKVRDRILENLTEKVSAIMQSEDTPGP